MSVTNSYVPGSYTGNGVATVYAYAFEVADEDDLLVKIAGVTKTITTDYTVSGVGSETGGNVTFTVAPANGVSITIERNITYTRATDFQRNGAFEEATVDGDFDRLTMQVQQLDDRAKRSAVLALPVGGVTTPIELPAPGAGKFLRWNVGGTALEAIAASPDDDTFTQSGTGAVARSWSSKVGDVVSAKDFGTVGVSAVADEAIIQLAIDALKANGRGGTLYINPDVHAAANVPALGLTNGLSIAVIDQRMDKTNAGNDSFGTFEFYVEGRDSSGNYASEIRLRGKQNPAFGVNTVSDGTANGYPLANKASSFMHFAAGENWYQYITDPLFKGYNDWGMVQYTNAGTANFVFRVGPDGNFKSRVDVTPSQLASAVKNVSGATNASPIVITTSTAHGIAGAKAPVTIASVGGNTAANGQWLVNVLTTDTFELINSTGNGAYTSGGTATVQPNSMRATLNVPAIQGGTEAIVAEGTVVAPALLLGAGVGETFDYYDEGTFTPTIAGDSTAGAQTYSVQAGFWTRIGNRVFFNARVVMTAKDGATAGNLTITGLPFTSSATVHSHSAVSVANVGNIDLSAGLTQITAEVQPNGTVIHLGEAGDNAAFALLQAAALQATSKIVVSGNYVIS